MKSIDRKQVARFVIAVAFIGAVLFIAINTAEAKKLFGYSVTILTPFIYGFCIAYVLNLLVKQIEEIFTKIKSKKEKKNGKKKKESKASRVWSIILSILVFVAFAALTIGMVIPNVKDTVTSLYKQAPELWDGFIKLLEKIQAKYPAIADYITKFENGLEGYYTKAVTWLKGNWSNILSGALSKIKSASNVAFNFFIGFVIAFAMLIYKEKLVKEVYMIMRRILSDRWYGYFCYVQELTNKKFQIFLKYNVVQAVITGVGTFLVMLVSGMPYKASISLLITVTQLIPIIGAITGTTVSALLIAAVSPIKAIIFIALSILVQQLVEKLINPHLMGKELEMPGILTFLAVVLGGKQFGIIGLICAVPVVSVLFDIYTVKLRPKMKKANAKNDEKEEKAAE